MATANNEASVSTIEGSPEIAELARVNFQQLQLNNITFHAGNFDDLLPSILSNHPVIDLAYIDGNHRYQPTINYFQQFLPKVHNDTILVFDDIHWSEEMENAWHEIKLHHAVKCTIDIFFLGFVFFKKELMEKQHFTIRF